MLKNMKFQKEPIARNASDFSDNKLKQTILK